MMKLGLAFSGGKDSWACLWLNRERLHEITVLWVDTGKNYPELLATVEAARQMCPIFVRVPADRDEQNRINGIPADVVPVQWTRVGQSMSGSKSVTVQPYLSCCFENISLPLHRAAIEHGITHLIRGQRDDEAHKSPSRHGAVVDGGITYLHPIEGWSSQDVLSYVGKHMELPEHFKFKHSSMDCYDCTAYRRESADRVAFMQERHPELYAEYAARDAQLNAALAEALNES
jgi:3'-phosphoadenosine 5'-phosphosulfate sulfotransferase (PAPS reductase)/FAD synthetase